MMRTVLKLAVMCFSLLGLAIADGHSLELKTEGKRPAVLRLEAGDIWVMAGDSITEQRLHTNYIEAFFRTRYPALALRFRNAGISGDTAEMVDKRFATDIAAFKPALVSFELGMNDAWIGWDRYRAGLSGNIKQAKAISARVLLISSSPLNDGSSMDDWQSERCCQIHPLTNTLERIGEEEGLPVVDQYHPLLELWSANQAAGRLRKQLERASAMPAISGDAEAAKAIAALKPALENLEKQQLVFGGDTIHAGPLGQYTMAVTILQRLGVERKVSSAVLDYSGKVLSEEGCKISQAASQGGKLSFTRQDECLPWPVAAKQMDNLLKLMPQAAELSQYMLKLENLPAGSFKISMNSQQVAVVKADELAKGINLGCLKDGPLAEQGAKVMALLDELQAKHVASFRDASRKQDAAAMLAASKAIDECEVKLTAACKPASVIFELSPAGE